MQHAVLAHLEEWDVNRLDGHSCRILKEMAERFLDRDAEIGAKQPRSARLEWDEFCREEHALLKGAIERLNARLQALRAEMGPAASEPREAEEAPGALRP